MKYLYRHTRAFRRILGRSKKFKKGKSRAKDGGVVISEQYQAPLKINGVFPNNKQGKRVFLELPLCSFHYPSKQKKPTDNQ